MRPKCLSITWWKNCLGSCVIHACIGNLTIEKANLFFSLFSVLSRSHQIFLVRAIYLERWHYLAIHDVFSHVCVYMCLHIGYGSIWSWYYLHLHHFGHCWLSLCSRYYLILQFHSATPSTLSTELFVILGSWSHYNVSIPSPNLPAHNSDMGIIFLRS